jgi:23S rRNA (cytidine2498-2'-O)-methyltransferase
MYCRQGFENECAAEMQEKADNMGLYGFAKTKGNSGFVLFQCHEDGAAEQLARKVDFSQLVFARQLILVLAHVVDMPLEDRISAVIANATDMPVCGNLMVETADTSEAKELSKFCRKFTVPLRQAMRKAEKMLPDEVENRPTMHLMFTSNDTAYLGYSYSYNHSPLPMGIMRLKSPSDAPSRSTLKLEEAFLTFIPKSEHDTRLASGLKAVDLGASPGGWTYQLVRRGMMVAAVDNGPMDDSLMQTGQVKHRMEDGFKYTPSRRNVHWLVCDMIEKPMKVANLMAWWLVEGYCQEAIFNLKLPMKRRYDEMRQCFAVIDETLKENGVKYKLQAKHLYHDREEITVHLRKI